MNPIEQEDDIVSESENESESEMQSDYEPETKAAKVKTYIDEDGEEDEDDDDSEIEYADNENYDNDNENESQQNMNTLFGENILGDDNSEDEEDEDEDEEEDEDHLKKIDETYQKKILNDHHPELKTLNYEEIESLCIIVKDTQGNIIDPLHKTPPFLSRYEKARILGERAEQINSGAEPFIEVEPTILDGYLIALKELEQKKIPFIIQRPMPNGGSEYWRLRDLEML